MDLVAGLVGDRHEHLDGIALVESPAGGAVGSRRDGDGDLVGSKPELVGELGARQDLLGVHRLGELPADQAVEHVGGHGGAIQRVVHADVRHRHVSAAQRRARRQVASGDDDRAGVAGADPEGDRTGQRGQGEHDADERARIGASRPPKGSGRRQGRDGHGSRAGALT